MQRRKVRTSTGHYPRFTLPMDSSPGFGSTSSDYVALFRLAFASAPELQFLNLAPYSKSPDHSSIGTPPSRQVGTTTFCRLTVSDLFHSPLGVLFTFPSRYWYAIGDQRYLALEGGPPDFPQDFSCPVVLRVYAKRTIPFVYGALTLYGSPFQVLSTRDGFCNSSGNSGASPSMPYNPTVT